MEDKTASGSLRTGLEATTDAMRVGLGTANVGAKSELVSKVWGALPRGTLAKLSQAGDTGLSQALFSAKEVSQLRAAVCQALGTDVAWAEQTFELTPYKFHLVRHWLPRSGTLTWNFVIS